MHHLNIRRQQDVYNPFSQFSNQAGNKGPQYYQYMTGMCLSEKPEQGRIIQGALARLPSFQPAVRGPFRFCWNIQHTAL